MAVKLNLILCLNRWYWKSVCNNGPTSLKQREESDICKVRHLLLNLEVSLKSIFHCYYLGSFMVSFVT